MYTSYHIRLISKYKDLKTKVVSWFSLVIGQNASRQLATSSENLVASAQFLVALATSESQFRALASCMQNKKVLKMAKWERGLMEMWAVVPKKAS